MGQVSEKASRTLCLLRRHGQLAGICRFHYEAKRLLFKWLNAAARDAA